MAEQETSTVRATSGRVQPRDERRAQPRLSTGELPRIDGDLGRVHLAGLFPSWREFLRAPSALLAYLRSVALHLR
ncbi:MAG: hypothetical protein ACLQQB_04710 [Solirubrobacteraceae bacterium]|jgi:hypothetical protein